MALYEPKDITGKRYGKLTALHRTSDKNKRGAYKWLCECECGNLTVVCIDNLRENGGTQSCGCINRTTIEEYEARKKDELSSITSEWEYIRHLDRDKNSHRIRCVVCGCERSIRGMTNIPQCLSCEREKKKLQQKLQQEQSKYKECAICGETFESVRCTAMYCSVRCKRKSKAIRHPDIKRERRKISKRLREARATKNGKVDYSITLSRLTERDQGVCQLCGLPVDERDYVYVGDTFIAGNNYPSIDHITPLSKGGVHQWDNVQLAHRICNSIKCDNE